MRALAYCAVFTVPGLIILSVMQGGWWIAATLVYVFAAIPMLDHLVGLRTDNEDTDGPKRRWNYDLPLWAYVGTQLAVQGWALWLVGTGQLSTLESVLATLVVGVMSGGLGITVAHELMHRPDKPEQIAAEVLMGSVTYTHFCIEHVHGHHRHVATPHDPATSRLGESVYRFLPRTVFGSLLSAIEIERELARKKKISPWSLRHRITRYALTQVVVYGIIGAVFGPIGLAFWAGQSVVGFLLLETINYVEHYGLQRRELSSGKYERVQPWHSWNASHRLTNLLLFNLQRHSDHHYLASRPYHQLRHYEDVPQLPAGYATMVILALVPPLWRRVMDPRVAAWNQKKADDVGSIGAAAA